MSTASPVHPGRSRRSAACDSQTRPAGGARHHGRGLPRIRLEESLRLGRGAIAYRAAMDAGIGELMAAVERPGWRWDAAARVLKHDALDLAVPPEQLERLGIEDDRGLHIALLGYETRARTGGHEGFQRPRSG